MTPAEQAIERAWWQSKKLAAVMAHHLVSTMVAVFGLIQYPSQAGAILAGYFSSAAAVTSAHLASQAATDRAQAASPNYPLPPAAYGAPAAPPPIPPPTDHPPAPGATPGMS